MASTERNNNTTAVLPEAPAVGLSLLLPPVLAVLFLGLPQPVVATAAFFAISAICVQVARRAIADDPAELPRAGLSLSVMSALQVALAAYVGIAIGGFSGLAAFLALVVSDLILSCGALIALERGRGVMGLSSAWLIGAKFDGLFGRLA